MSHTSRSNQFAIGQSGTAVGTTGVVLLDPRLDAHPMVVGDRVEMVDDLEPRGVSSRPG